MTHSGSARRRARAERIHRAIEASTPAVRAALWAWEALEPRRLLAGAISGTVFKDANSNGSLDAGDLGMSGVTVYLDLDSSSSLTPADTTTTTDINGAYGFSGLADGTYSIGEVTPAGVVRVGALFESATVTGGNTVTGKNLANFPYVFTGSNGSDMWTVRMDPGNSTRVQIIETLLGKPTVIWSITKSSIPSITINANSGDDIFVIDYSNGDPLPAGGINIDGSTQTLNGDKVTVTGGGGADVVSISNLDIASGAGLIAIKGLEGTTVNGGFGNDSINLRVGLPIPIACDGQGGTDTLTFNGYDGDDDISTTPGIVSDLTISHTYAQIELLDVKTRGGNDRVDINDTSSASTFDLGDGADEMVINIVSTGSVGVLGGLGNDKLTVLQDVSVPVSFTGGDGADQVTVTGTNSNDSIDISGTTVSPQGGLYTLMYSAETVYIDAAEGNDTITANQSASATTINVTGGVGDDMLTTSSGGSIVFDDALGQNTAIFNASSANETITLSANTILAPGRGLALINVANWVINAMGGHDTINVPTSLLTSNVTVNGGDGYDAMTIDAAQTAAMTFNGGLGAGDVDTLNVNQGTHTFAADAKLTTANLVVNVGASGTVNFNATQHLASLNVSGHASLSAGGSKVLRTNSLTASGWLDLHDNDLIIDYVSTSPLGSWNGSGYTGLTGMVQSGMNGGTWDGNGLMTSSTNDMIGVFTGLGCAEAKDILGLGAGQTETWSGETVNDRCVLVKFTYMGDMDLNGELNGDDYFYIDSNILNSGAVFGYHNGDVELNGELNGDDYFYIDSNIPAQTVVL